MVAIVLSTALLGAAPAFGQTGGGAAGDEYTEQPPAAGGQPGDSGGGSPGSDTSAGGNAGNTSPSAGSENPGRTIGGTGGTASPGGTGGAASTGRQGALSRPGPDFAAEGPDGVAAAGLGEETAPDSEALRQAIADAQAGADGQRDTRSEAGPVGSSVSGLSGDGATSGGVGRTLLPILLVLILLSGLAYRLITRRRAADASSAKTISYRP